MAWYQTLIGVTSSSSPSSFDIEKSWMVDTPTSSSSSNYLFSSFGSANLGRSAGAFDSSQTSFGLAPFVLDSDIVVSNLGKIASGLYALLDDKLEHWEVESCVET